MLWLRLYTILVSKALYHLIFFQKFYFFQMFFVTIIINKWTEILYYMIWTCDTWRYPYWHCDPQRITWYQSIIHNHNRTNIHQQLHCIDTPTETIWLYQYHRDCWYKVKYFGFLLILYYMQSWFCVLDVLIAISQYSIHSPGNTHIPYEFVQILPLKVYLHTHR